MDYHIELFSGIAGFELGLRQAGFKFKKTYWSEINKYASAIYRKHYEKAEELGAVENIRTNRIKGKGIVTFGFPCQDISVAGKRGGLQASRSGLFFKAMQIIDRLRPEYFIFENVKGLFSINEGRDFITILQTVTDCGYDGQWQLVNTRWVLPQNRERIYFIGHIRGQSRPKVFPITESSRIYNAKEKSKKGIHQIARTLTARQYADWRGNFVVSKIVRLVKNNPKRKHRFDSENFHAMRTIRLDGVAIFSRPHGFNKGGVKDLPCLRSCNSFDKNELLIENSKIRKLTLIECERLQGFPDDWTKFGIDEKRNEIEISNSQRYKCLGNAVSVPIVKMIGERIKSKK